MTCCINAYTIIGGLTAVVLALKAYQKYIVGWCKSKTCLVGKTVIVTGANTGIGYDAAVDFAQRGARVILACRDKARAEAARAKIVEETQNENVVVKILDLTSFASVRKFAEDINKNEKRLDILVNNAGLGLIADEKTQDGHTVVMQVNHLSHFLLTNLLMGLLKKSAPSRIINVSSAGAKLAKLNLNNINEYKGRFTLYANSKVCNILFTIELAEKLKGTGVTAYSLHPGAVHTEFSRYIHDIIKAVLSFFLVFFKSSEEGAQTTIHTAVAKGIEGNSGEHFEDCKKVKRYATARDPGLPKKLWEISETAVNLKPEEIQF